jgi:hypothetical protein
LRGGIAQNSLSLVLCTFPLREKALTANPDDLHQRLAAVRKTVNHSEILRARFPLWLCGFVRNKVCPPHRGWPVSTLTCGPGRRVAKLLLDANPDDARQIGAIRFQSVYVWVALEMRSEHPQG